MRCHKCKKELWFAMIGAGSCINKKCARYLLCQTSQEHIDSCDKINEEYETRPKKRWWKI